MLAMHHCQISLPSNIKREKDELIFFPIPLRPIGPLESVENPRSNHVNRMAKPNLCIERIVVVVGKIYANPLKALKVGCFVDTEYHAPMRGER